MDSKTRDLSPAEMADLSALADGSLEPARRKTVEAWIASSPELSEVYERERAAVQVLRTAAAERAPLGLRLRLEAERGGRARRPRARTGYGVLAGAVAAAVIVAALLVLPGGAPGSPSVSQAAGLALRGPASPPPSADAADPRTKLAGRFQAIYFPNWSVSLGWRAVGVRRDRLDGRATMTVYYRRGGALVAYTIVGSPALSSPSGQVRRLNGYELRTFRLGGRTVVTWRRAGHTCVLSAAGVTGGTLQHLASWGDSGIGD